MTDAVRPDIGSIEAVEAGLVAANYICNRQTATAIYLAQHLRKPVLVEGPAGVGKTELARATAQYLGLPLIRMQCYEGLDESKALYEWKYGKQLLYTQILKDTYGASLRGVETIGEALEKIGEFDDVFFSEQFLEARPLLAALRQEHGAVLLVDEIDKSDQEFEAFLLEILSDYQVTIPEIGTISATVPPLVVLTSNDSRDLGDALKRRCLHLHIGYPDAKLEERIIDVRVPGVEDRLRAQLVAFVQKMRTFELKKLPSVSETIDWARALVLLHVTELDGDAIRDTLNILLKYESDIESMKRHVSSILTAVN
ncbi:MAG: MoxR family ATPase [Candidatus Eremiobacteraeota bacterium]|nr:MoxR family ATPase [Candidatus Eremiobacteraeota bacterium]